MANNTQFSPKAPDFLNIGKKTTTYRQKRAEIPPGQTQDVVVCGKNGQMPAFSSPTKLPAPGAGTLYLGRKVKIFDNKLELQRDKFQRPTADNTRQKIKNELIRTVSQIADRKVTCYHTDPFKSWQLLRRLVEKKTFLEKMMQKSNRAKSYGWSHKSRLALIRRLGEATASNFQIPFFVTLTYHLKFPDAQGAKRHLKAFFARLKRLDENFGYVWKMEFQDRGAPHFHAIIFPSSGEITGSRIRRAWNDIAQDDETDRAHQKYGTDVERCEELKSFRKMYRYVSKYAAKQVEKDEPNGRYWGTSTNLVDETKTSRFPITEGSEVIIRRIAKRLLRGVKPYHGNRRVCEYNPRETKKMGSEYFELPKLSGYHRPDGKWVNKSRYGKQIAEKWRGYSVHLLMDREQAYRVLDFACSFLVK